MNFIHIEKRACISIFLKIVSAVLGGGCMTLCLPMPGTSQYISWNKQKNLQDPAALSLYLIIFPKGFCTINFIAKLRFPKSKELISLPILFVL